MLISYVYVYIVFTLIHGKCGEHTFKVKFSGEQSNRRSGNFVGLIPIENIHKHSPM